MSNNKILIPDSIVIYLLGFLLACGILTGSLVMYYHLPALAARFGEENVSALNLESSQNFLHWFFSVLWIIIAMDSLLILCQAKEMALGLKSCLFWGNIGILAIVMSVDSFCSFHPVLCALFNSCLDKTGTSSAAVSAIYIVIRLLVASFLFIQISYLLGYLRAQRTNRWFLSAGLATCVFVFVLSCFCSWQIPQPGQRESTDLPESVEVTGGLIAQDGAKQGQPLQETLGVSQAEDARIAAPASDTGPFRNVSVEQALEESDSVDSATGGKTSSQPERSPTGYFADKEPVEESHEGVLFDPNLATVDSVDVSDEPASPSNESGSLLAQNAKLEQWEDLFGWEESLEDILGLSNSVEDCLGWEKSVEENVIGNGVVLDLARLRVIVRYGVYGLFLILFCTLVRLIVRAGKRRHDRQIRSRVDDILTFSEAMRHSNCPRF
ncbi:MAG: hypothetical protein Q4G68_14925 [Planctomycetia bacterium]|nr:hypothetical protein [Planctomycetia bacterium]